MLVSVCSFSQTAPELVFTNPVLKSGTANRPGAIYRFSNVTPGVDAEVLIKKFSRNDIKMNTIDNGVLGWNKAFQPEFGLPGIVLPWQHWYVDFEMAFYEAGKNKRVRMAKIDLTALDVDGDNWSISEYVSYERPASISYSTVSYLVDNGVNLLGAILPCSQDNISSVLVLCTNCLGLGKKLGEDCQNCEGSGLLHDQCDHAFQGVQGATIQGPVQNFLNIDTSATQVMATYHYEDTDRLKFRYGARSSSNSSNGSGIRLNSTWFRQFNLAPVSTLPVTFHKFTASLERNHVILNWSIDTDDIFSHYVVERSYDGKEYTDIGIVMTSGTANPSEISHYKFKDQDVKSNNGIVYYRLRWEEINRETYYSPVRIVRISKSSQANELVIYPNPVKEQLRLTLPQAYQGQKLEIALYTAGGGLVSMQRINSASQTEVVEVGKLAKGFYLLKINCNGQVSQQRIIKD